LSPLNAFIFLQILTTMTKPSIVLIHGLWMTPVSWEHWVTHYEKAGYTVLAPAWPGLENRTNDDIRRDPSALKGLTIKKVVDHYESLIKELSSPPIIMGHSFGGLFVQMLLSRGHGVAGISVDPAQPSGVLVLPLSTIKAGSPILAKPWTYNGTVSLTPKEFHYAFTNELTLEESQKVYEKYHIPGAAHILWQAALGLLNKKGPGAVHFANVDRAPLLLIGGSNDHIAPPAIQKATQKNYSGPAVVEYKEFEGRTHHIVGQVGWEEVADYALQWAEKHIAK
jgi:non-heme chloroperoxidase